MPPINKKQISPSVEGKEKRKKFKVPYNIGRRVSSLPDQSKRAKNCGNRIKDLKYLISIKKHQLPEAKRVLVVIRTGSGAR